MKPSFDLLPPTVVLLPRARRSVFAAKWRIVKINSKEIDTVSSGFIFLRIFRKQGG